MAGAPPDHGAAHPAALEARTLAAQLPAEAWTRRRVREGSRGPEYADFAIRRVVASRDGLPGPDVWLVLRRRPGSDGLKVFLCHAPGRITPARLARLTSTRWAIETCFQEGKQLLAGRLRGPQLAGLASPHDPMPAPALFPAAGPAGPQKNSPA